ncbi:MAG: hypothetical protein R3332_02480 [Pseudohongiellaceae bacterium]|nr:hypothetical protein [Pseudohongiellaceae bacterium]
MSTNAQSSQPNLIKRIILGHYGLARTYWSAYFIGAAAFFIFGSMAVSAGEWKKFVIMLFSNICYSFILLLGIQAGYQGADPGKGLSRIAILFLLLNLSNALATLVFI